MLSAKTGTAVIRHVFSKNILKLPAMATHNAQIR